MGRPPGYAAPAAPEWVPPQVQRPPAQFPQPTGYGYPPASPTPSSMPAPFSPLPPSPAVPPSWPSLAPGSQPLRGFPVPPGSAAPPSPWVSTGVNAADNQQSQALAALAREYWQRIHVAHDPAADAITIAFDHCRLHTADEITAAFAVLTEQTRRMLAALGRPRSALLVDIAGLDIGGDVTPLWGRSLKEFLTRACIATRPDRYLVARYNSSALAGPLSPEALQAVLTRVQIMTEAAMEGFQSNIFGSREEAVAVLSRMRELAGGPRR